MNTVPLIELFKSALNTELGSDVFFTRKKGVNVKQVTIETGVVVELESILDLGVEGDPEIIHTCKIHQEGEEGIHNVREYTSELSVNVPFTSPFDALCFPFLQTTVSTGIKITPLPDTLYLVTKGRDRGATLTRQEFETFIELIDMSGYMMAKVSRTFNESLESLEDYDLA